jgi:hypothetical protein
MFYIGIPILIIIVLLYYTIRFYGQTAMIRPVNSNLRARIAELVFGGSSPTRAESNIPGFEQIIRAQAERFRERSIRPHVAILYDEDDLEKVNKLEVPIRADELGDLDRSYRRTMGVLERSGIQLKQLHDVGDMETAFVDRLAESTAVLFAETYKQINGPTVVSRSDTIVNSNRSNDTILYAKGYFLSTGTAFGLSTPATAYLLPSRYSFGIMEPGGPRFENIVWSCPATVRLNLP